MKKLLAVLLALVMVLSLAACGAKTEAPAPEAQAEQPAEEPVAEETFVEVPPETVMSYAEYIAADLDTEVTVDCYVQAHQSWWDGKITVYAADEDGAYFLYELACDEADAALFDQPGLGIRVIGYKSEWSGEVEIVDGTYEVLSQTYEAQPVDVTDLLGQDALIGMQNALVSFSGMVVEPSNDEGAAFLYSWDGSGSHEGNSDLYFNVSKDGKVYNFTVESYLCGNDTEVYAAVENFQVGDIVDMEGFLYWYNGVNPHITAVNVLGNVADKAEGSMTAEEFAAADIDTQVVVEGFVQAAAYNAEYGNICLYLQDGECGYYVYRMPATDADAEALAAGQKVIVTGYKSEWSGEVEIADATYVLADGSYVAPAVDVTAALGTDELVAFMNMNVAFSGMTVEPIADADGNEAAFLYNWDGSGEEGNDLYFNVSLDGVTYNFCVESDECGADTEVYQAVKALNIGDVINLEGFLYWYNGANPHITAVSAAA